MNDQESATREIDEQELVAEGLFEKHVSGVVNYVNQTPYTFTLTKSTTNHGSFASKPIKTIPPNSRGMICSTYLTIGTGSDVVLTYQNSSDSSQSFTINPEVGYFFGHGDISSTQPGNQADWHISTSLYNTPINLDNTLSPDVVFTINIVQDDAPSWSSSGSHRFTNNSYGDIAAIDGGNALNKVSAFYVDSEAAMWSQHLNPDGSAKGSAKKIGGVCTGHIAATIYKPASYSISAYLFYSDGNASGAINCLAASHSNPSPLPNIKNNSGKLQAVVFNNPPNVAPGTSLYLFYVVSGKIKYALFDGDHWVIDQDTGATTNGAYTVTHYDGKLWLFYVMSGAGVVNLRTYTHGTWSEASFSAPINVRGDISACADAEYGNLHLAFTQGSAKNGEYALAEVVYDGTDWSDSKTIGSSKLYSGGKLALSRSGKGLNLIYNHSTTELYATASSHSSN